MGEHREKENFIMQIMIFMRENLKMIELTVLVNILTKMVKNI